jgi:transglutaminase-like putative cysteine protease
MFLELEQRLAFQYDAFISESFLELRVQPKTTEHQTLSAFLLAVGPPTQVHRYRDWNDNTAHHFTITKYHDTIQVLSRALVDTHPAYPALAAVTDRTPAGELPYRLRDFLQFGGPVRATPALRKLHREARVPAGAPLGEQVRLLGQHIHQRFRYQKHVTRYDSTTEDFLRLGAGVCQDFTHLMLACLRLRGIPCRYVSGILHVRGKRGEPAQSHAWIEFHSPARGWVAYDPTHARELDERYVVVAHGRHYDDVPPNKGIYRGNAAETLRAEVVTRPSAQKGVSTLHEEIQQIDLPVYQEIPDRRVERVAALVLAEEAATQQQQQQR